MRTIYRIDGKDFDDLDHALDHAAATHFRAGADIQYEREPNRDGYEFLVFDDADDSENRPGMTIFEITA